VSNKQGAPLRDLTRVATNVTGADDPTAPRGQCGWADANAQVVVSDFVWDRIGRRFVACARDEAERKTSHPPRVRVAARQL